VGNLLRENETPSGLMGFIGLFTANPVLAGYVAFVVWLGLMALSFHLSCAFYRNRDF
jgi:hypothetical protein